MCLRWSAHWLHVYTGCTFLTYTLTVAFIYLLSGRASPVHIRVHPHITLKETHKLLFTEVLPSTHLLNRINICTCFAFPRSEARQKTPKCTLTHRAPATYTEACAPGPEPAHRSPHARATPGRCDTAACQVTPPAGEVLQLAPGGAASSGLHPRRRQGGGGDGRAITAGGMSILDLAGG